MKRIAPLLFMFLLFACFPAKDKKKANGKTTSLGTITSANCSLDEFYYNINSKPIELNVVPYGCALGLRLKGLSGFKAKAGSVFCNASIQVLDSNNVELIKLDDVLQKTYPNGMKEETFTDLIELFVYLQAPIKMNQKYKLICSLKDKEGDASMEISETFITHPASGLQYEEKGLTSDGFFLYRNNTKTPAMSDNAIFHGDTLLMYCTGLEGLTEEDGKVWVDGSIRYYSDKSELLGEFPDLFKAENENGLSAQEAKKYLSAMFISNPLIYGMKKDFHIIVRIADRKSDKSIVATYYFSAE